MIDIQYYFQEFLIFVSWSPVNALSHPAELKREDRDRSFFFALLCFAFFGILFVCSFFSFLFFFFLNYCQLLDVARMDSHTRQRQAF